MLIDCDRACDWDVVCWIYGDIGVYQFSSETTIDLLFVILVLLAVCCCWCSFCSFISFSIHRISIVWRFQVVCFSVCCVSFFFVFSVFVIWLGAFADAVRFSNRFISIFAPPNKNVSLRTHNADKRNTFCFANFIIFIRHDFFVYQCENVVRGDK